MDKRGVAGEPPMWMILLFYNIIIKCQNVDKGRGGGGQTMWIRFFFVFFKHV